MLTVVLVAEDLAEPDEVRPPMTSAAALPAIVPGRLLPGAVGSEDWLCSELAVRLCGERWYLE